MQELVHIEPINALTTNSMIVEALDCMEEHKISDLPVVDERNKYLGMVSEDALLNAGDDKGTVQTALNLSYSPYVLSGSHPFEVLAVAAQYTAVIHTSCTSASCDPHETHGLCISTAVLYIRCCHIGVHRCSPENLNADTLP